MKGTDLKPSMPWTPGLAVLYERFIREIGVLLRKTFQPFACSLCLVGLLVECSDNRCVCIAGYFITPCRFPDT